VRAGARGARTRLRAPAAAARSAGCGVGLDQAVGDAAHERDDLAGAARHRAVAQVEQAAQRLDARLHGALEARAPRGLVEQVAGQRGELAEQLEVRLVEAALGVARARAQRAAQRPLRVHGRARGRAPGVAHHNGAPGLEHAGGEVLGSGVARGEQQRVVLAQDQRRAVGAEAGAGARHDALERRCAAHLGLTWSGHGGWRLRPRARDTVARGASARVWAREAASRLRRS